jgi:hypothetical protein
LAIGIPAAVAILGIAVGYANAMRTIERRHQLDRQDAELTAQIERVNRQLSEFYGPLLALSWASSRAWEVFRGRYRPRGFFWGGPDGPPTDAEAEAWRTWMVEVFAPLHTQIETIVLSKADLLDSDAMPPCLIDLVAHVTSYHAVIAAWDRGNFDFHTTGLNFPTDLVEYASQSFERLKSRQQRLLGLHAAHTGGATPI